MSGFAAGPTRSVGVDRLTFLRRAGTTAAGIAGTRLAAPARAGARDATVKADPAVKRGGTLRFGVKSAFYDARHNRVRGQNPSTFFGIYDVVRWDTVSVAS